METSESARPDAGVDEAGDGERAVGDGGSVADGVDDGKRAVGDGGSVADDAGAQTDGDGPEPVRVWLVERTYSDDELNIVILIYATPDGERYLRKERALTSVGDRRDVTAAVEAAPSNLGRVEDPARRERYATEARRMRDEHDPGDTI